MKAKTVALIEALMDPDPCEWDHNHSCQTHGYFYLPQGEMCPNEEARRFVAKHKREEPEPAPEPPACDPPHGYVVVDIDADTEDEWDSYDMSVRDTTVYPDLALAQDEGIHEHSRNGLVETVRSSPSGTRLIRRIYALMPVNPKKEAQ